MAAKVNKPQSDKEAKPTSYADVFSVMKQYTEKKGFSFTDSKLRYLAEDCFLFWEGRKWKGISYWPAVCMRWVLNNLDKQIKCSYKSKPKPQGKSKSVREIILDLEAYSG